MSVDAIVVGGGIVGLAAARALAGAGARVTLLERGDRVGEEASGAAAGMLAAQAEAEEDSPTLRLELAARGRYPGLLAALARETGVAVAETAGGHLHVALDQAQEERLRRRGERQRALGLAAQFLTADELRQREPGLSPSVRGGLHLPADGRVDNASLVRALAASAVRRGAVIHCGRPVTALVVEDGRVAGVRAGGEVLRAGVVVSACGAWASQVSGDPAPPPVEPVRGQMVALQPAAPLIRHVLWSARPGYLVPTAEGRILAGSTLEHAGFDKSVTAAGLQSILAMARELVPALRDVPVAATWAGLRPASPDGVPIVGAGSLRGLVHAAGLFRGGVLLGPLVGEIAADLALGRDPGFDLRPFAPSRFQP